jgi:hypothetical protein
MPGFTFFSPAAGVLARDENKYTPLRKLPPQDVVKLHTRPCTAGVLTEAYGLLALQGQSPRAGENLVA